MSDSGSATSSQNSLPSQSIHSPVKRWWPLVAYLLLCCLLAAFDGSIKDASLGKIAELNPRSLVLWDTRVTAQGLLQSKLQKTLIFLNSDQFTPAEWKQLDQNMNIGSGYFE